MLKELKLEKLDYQEILEKADLLKSENQYDLGKLKQHVVHGFNKEFKEFSIEPDVIQNMLREFDKASKQTNSKFEAFDFEKFYLRSSLVVKYFNSTGWPTSGGCTQYDFGDIQTQQNSRLIR